MNKVVKFYNNKQADSIVNMWPESYRSHMNVMWNKASIESMMNQFGKIKSGKYLGIDTDDPNHVTVFTIQTSKAGQKNTSFTVDTENHLGTFQFITSSDGIDKLLKQAK